MARCSYKPSNLHSSSVTGFMTTTAQQLCRPSLSELQPDLASHLRETTLSFVVDRGRHYLSIPGHIPFEWAPSPSRKTGTAFYEETSTLVLDYLLKRLRPTNCFDIGASGGYFSRVAASYRGSAPQVDAFEMRAPVAAAMRRAIENDQFAPRINLHVTGVSDRDAESVQVWLARSLLFEEQPLPREYKEAWWRRAKFRLRNDRSRGLSTVSLPVISIDGFTKRSRRLPDIIKIDVEGYEGKVLLGALDTLRSARPFILLELHKDEKQRFGMRRQDVAQLIFDQGYDALLLTDHQNKSRCEVVPVGPRDAILGRQRTDMLLFVPRQ
jgi:FkbM family methyltransferase